MATIAELNSEIKRLHRQLTAMPFGAERAMLQETKNAIARERDDLIRTESAAAIASEFGAMRITNDSRTPEQRRADADAREARQRERTQKELDSFGDLLKPRRM